MNRVSFDLKYNTKMRLMAGLRADPLGAPPEPSWIKEEGFGRGEEQKIREWKGKEKKGKR